MFALLYVTERAVFRIGARGLELIEVAPGVDVERDIFAQMEFRPQVSPDLRTMDARLFQPARLGIHDEVVARERRFRSARIAQWLAETQR